jgi:agmatinase
MDDRGGPRGVHNLNFLPRALAHARGPRVEHHMQSSGIFFRPQVSLEEADIAIIGFPWDGTVSNRPGARFGPQAIRSATLAIEDYSPYQNRDMGRLSVHDAGDIELPFGNTAACLAMISAEYAQLASRKVVALGGEHLVAWPLISAMRERWGESLFVIQFDAHADLRDEYLGVRESHATVMRLVHGLVGSGNTAAVGIRSGTADEWAALRNHPRVYGGASERPLSAFGELGGLLAGKKVYLTIDLDVFDPAVMPGTGTPEPGGIFFPEFVGLLKTLEGMDIVGADIVELAPDYDHSGISAALAGTVLREVLLLMAGKE